MITPESYDDYKAAFGADLEAAEAAWRAPRRQGPRRQQSPRRHVRVRRVLAGATGVAIAGTVAVLAIDGAGPAQRIDVVARAQAALAPRAGILHVRAVTVDESTYKGRPVDHAPGTARRRGEFWWQPDKARWREKTHQSKRMFRRPGGQLRPAVEPYEGATADGAETSYWALKGRMYVVTGLNPKRGEKPPPGALGDRRGSSLDDLRDMLAAGELRDRGMTTLGGRQVRRLVGISTDQHGTRSSVDYRVDPTTFEPVQLTVSTQPKGWTLRMVHRVDYEVYEHLPASPANERLLEVHPPAGTRVITRTVEEGRALAKKRARTR